MQAFAKVDRPPAGENFARLNYPDQRRTAMAIFRFAKNGMAWNYNLGKKVVRYRIEDRIDWKTAKRILDSNENRIGKPFNDEFAEAFFKFENEYPLDGVRAFSEFESSFRVARNIAVPVRPLTVIRKDGRFVPVFVVPWSNVYLSEFQFRLLFTILEDALFTQADFENSPGEILFFPKASHGGRSVKIWKRGDFQLLSRQELKEQLSLYLLARSEAREMYRRYLDSH